MTTVERPQGITDRRESTPWVHKKKKEESSKAQIVEFTEVEVSKKGKKER